MNLKTICFALFVCLAFLGTAMAYQTIISVTFNSGTSASYGTITQLNQVNARVCTSAAITSSPSNPTYITNGYKSYGSMPTGSTVVIGPVTLVPSDLYGIRVQYDDYIAGSTRGTSDTWVSCPLAACTSADAMWFIA